LELEQFHGPGVLAGRGDRAQLAPRVGEQDPGGVGGQQRNAVGDESVEQVDDVVVVDQGVASAPNASLTRCSRATWLITAPSGETAGHRSSSSPR
jgi:hypothetical protein